MKHNFLPSWFLGDFFSKNENIIHLLSVFSLETSIPCNSLMVTGPGLEEEVLAGCGSWQGAKAKFGAV